MQNNGAHLLTLNSLRSLIGEFLKAHIIFPSEPARRCTLGPDKVGSPFIAVSAQIVTEPAALVQSPTERRWMWSLPAAVF